VFESLRARHFHYHNHIFMGEPKHITPKLLERLMSKALEQAQLAAEVGEVPVGAVFYHNGEIISAKHNLVETNHDASAHAEMLVIKEASNKLSDWRLNEGILCVTLEPCSMCSGAIRLSRVGTLVFGANDPSLGAVGSLFDICADPRLGPLPRGITGVKQDDCGKILKNFFSKLRS
jgi:tRNA(adenine34) deaminase